MSKENASGETRFPVGPDGQPRYPDAREVVESVQFRFDDGAESVEVELADETIPVMERDGIEVDSRSDLHVRIGDTRFDARTVHDVVPVWNDD